jgi:IS30 family transposase
MKEYKQITLKERKKLYLLVRERKSIRAIAIKLGRSPSTISRELSRNSEKNELCYLPSEAHQKANKRKARRSKKLKNNQKAKDFIIEGLNKKWSPEVIAGRMKKEKLPSAVCTETIYQWIYGDEARAFGLYKFLLKGRPRRLAKRGRKKRKILIPDRISVHERPKYVDEKNEFGHFEGDLTFCKGLSHNIGVLIEKSSRFVLLAKNTSKKTDEVIKGMFNLLAQFPKKLLKSVTFDNGLEFAKHTALKLYLNMETYFCDPHSPWQKGQVEQANSMIHRYIKKKESLKNYSDADILSVQEQYNNLPRKCLGFKTPYEVLFEKMNALAS